MYCLTFTAFPPFFSVFPLLPSSEDLPLLLFAPVFFFGGMIVILGYVNCAIDRIQIRSDRKVFALIMCR